MRRVLFAAAGAALVMVLHGVPLTARAPQSASIWAIDPAHSSAQFSVKHMMVSTVRGTLGKVTGTIEYDGASPAGIKADVRIDVAGINTGTEARDQDLRSPNFFDVAKYPTLTFKSKRVEPAGQGKFKMTGDLTMHGVTKEVTLDVDGPSAPLKMGPSLRVGASAATKINRRDFGLQYSRMVEAAPIVGDEVQIQIDVEATKKG
jgi:polyisoprenoid-binding protein YceI